MAGVVDQVAWLGWRFWLLWGLGRQEGGGEERASCGDGSGDDAADAEAVVEGVGGGLADGVGRSVSAVRGEVAGKAIRANSPDVTFVNSAP